MVVSSVDNERELHVKRFSVALLLLSIACLFGAVACSDDDDNATATPAASGAADEIKIGALLDFSGSWQTLGQASKATLELRADELNRKLQADGKNARVRLYIEDTGLNADTALQKLQSLYAQGVRIVIGPQSSSEVARIKDYADSNGIVVISQGSTASSLSVGNDNVYRLAPDDRLEAQALVAQLGKDGITSVLPVCRKDPGNQGLCQSVTQSFQGTLLPRVDYEQNASAGQVVSDIRTALGAQACSNCAVYLAAFDEAIDIFKAASSDSALRSIKWYGSDGMAQNAGLVAPENATAAAFASAVGYPNPLFALDDRDKGAWGPVFDQVKAKVGFDPDAFALSTYDALTIAVDTYVKAGGLSDMARFKQELVQTAKSNASITGSTELNDAGDRKAGSFDFWGVAQQGSGYGWRKVATYTSPSAATSSQPTGY